ncbi:MAG: ester cyclase [Pyrinomonadaceae bacterium]
MTDTELKNFIAEYTDEVWNKANVEAMNKYYAPDYVHHDVSRPDVSTLADYKQWANDLFAGLSEVNVAIDDLVGEEGKAVKRWTASGLHDKTFAGIPATNKRVSFSGVSIYRMVGDKIAESWYVYDMFGLLQQLGAIPSPERAEGQVG